MKGVCVGGYSKSGWVYVHWNFVLVWLAATLSPLFSLSLFSLSLSLSLPPPSLPLTLPPPIQNEAKTAMKNAKSKYRFLGQDLSRVNT